MKACIWKYPVDLPVNEHAMPAGARFLALDVQGATPTMWWLLDPDAPATDVRTFVVVGTGHREVEPGMHYVGTFQLGWFVGHVFAREEFERA